MQKECKPVRIAQIIGKMWAGGVEAVVFNYYRALDHNKIQFDFFYDADSTVEPSEDLIAMGARFYKLPPYQKVWKYICVLRKYLKANKYKIVHSHLNTLSVIPLFVAWLLKIEVRIAHNHSVPAGKEWGRYIVKNILRKFSKVFATNYFACSEKAGRWLFGDRIFDRGQVTIIKNAVDLKKFTISISEKELLRQKLGLTSELIIGHVGRFTYAKNHKKLLNIFCEIKKRIPTARLLLVGDGELKEDIKKQIHDLNMDDAVIFTGKVTDAERYYFVMDVVILPSIFEGFSITTIEAQLAGIPIVISKAVPEEAVISDGCKYMDIEAADVKWADTVCKTIGKRVVTDKRKDEFDISECALKLQNWYLRFY